MWVGTSPPPSLLPHACLPALSCGTPQQRRPRPTRLRLLPFLPQPAVDPAQRARAPTAGRRAGREASHHLLPHLAGRVRRRECARIVMGSGHTAVATPPSPRVPSPNPVLDASIISPPPSLPTCPLAATGTASAASGSRAACARWRCARARARRRPPPSPSSCRPATRTRYGTVQYSAGWCAWGAWGAGVARAGRAWGSGIERGYGLLQSGPPLAPRDTHSPTTPRPSPATPRPHPPHPTPPRRS